MQEKEVYSSPYEAARQAGLHSKKDRSKIKTEWCINPEGSFFPTDGKDSFLDTHPLGRKYHTYGSSGVK